MTNIKTANDIVSGLKESELAFLLTAGDPFIERLAGEDIDTPKRCGVFSDDRKSSVTVEVWPLLYNTSFEDLDPERRGVLATYRGAAINTVFKRWTIAGHNKHNAKSCWRCKSFMKYLEDIKWNDADYIILWVE